MTPPSPCLIAASMLAADAGALREAAQAAQAAGAHWLHWDVMDGHFVPNLTFGPHVLAALRDATSLHHDVHLMVARPADWIVPFAKAGAQTLTVHVESLDKMPALTQMLAHIVAQGVRAGVSINPDTPVQAIEAVLHRVDVVLVMSVRPGFGGQAFQPDVCKKIVELAQRRAQHSYTYLIEVDGGITADTLGVARAAGADVCVAGTAIFASPGAQVGVAKLREAAARTDASQSA